MGSQVSLPSESASLLEVRPPVPMRSVSTSPLEVTQPTPMRSASTSSRDTASDESMVYEGPSAVEGAASKVNQVLGVITFRPE